jgi:FkbM family methyltransferase
MAFSNAKQILRQTSGLSALKLLALTTQYSRPALTPLAKLFLGPFTKDGEVTITYRQGSRKLKALIRTADQQSDLHSALEVIARTVYPLDSAFAPDLVIDGGANIGLFSLQASATYPEAVILMCEPLPRNVVQIEKHIKLNHVKGELMPVCIGGTHGSIPFYCRHANASSFDPREKYESVMQMDVLRIGEIFGERTAHRILIKLDIEGMEVEALSDYVPAEDRIVIIFGELHQHRTTLPLMEKLFGEHGWSFQLGDLAGEDTIFEARSPAALKLGLKQQSLH